MTKQEEIREWVKAFLQGTAHNGYYDGLEESMLQELHSQGVVVKVERELPRHQNIPSFALTEKLTEDEVTKICTAYPNGVNHVAVEPLI